MVLSGMPQRNPAMTYYEHHVLMTLRLGRWAETGGRPPGREARMIGPTHGPTHGSPHGPTDDLRFRRPVRPPRLRPLRERRRRKGLLQRLPWPFRRPASPA